jgi:Uma2 family endonuclease
MTAEPHEPLTLAEFIAWELQQEDKHEFVDGYVSRLFGDPTIAGFAGGTVEHSRLAIALIERIRPAVVPCDTHGSDMLIQTTERRTRYADVVVTCDERDRARGTVILRFPKLVIEVLSESTARDDLGPKMREYHALATLEEYVTIDSRKRWAQASYREPAGTWTQLSPTTDGTLSLHSIGVDIDLDALYTGAGVLHDGHGDAAGL